jgi:hypothetical protein
MNRAIQCYRLCLSVGENPASSAKVRRSTTKGRPFRFNKEPTVYEAKEKENGENYKLADFTQIDQG